MILKAKDVKILEYLIAHRGFIFSQQDFESFITVAIIEKWLPGLKIFLLSSAVQFYFTSISKESQYSVLAEVVAGINKIADEKSRKPFASTIVEDIFTRKPYVKYLTYLLLESTVPATFERAKIARECLKNLTAEDFTQLA